MLLNKNLNSIRELSIFEHLNNLTANCFSCCPPSVVSALQCDHVIIASPLPISANSHTLPWKSQVSVLAATIAINNFMAKYSIIPLQKCFLMYVFMFSGTFPLLTIKETTLSYFFLALIMKMKMN